MKKLMLTLSKIARLQARSAGAKIVFSEGEVAATTSKEEKQFAAQMRGSGDGGALGRVSLNQQGFIPMLITLFLLLVIGVVFVYLRVRQAGH